MLASLLLGGGTQLQAAHPQIEFDVAPLAACEDVTTEAFARANPDEKLIEVRVDISTWLMSGSEADLSEFLFRINSPHRTMQVVDFEPKTSLASDYAGNINVEKKNEQSRSLGLSVNTTWDHLIRLSGVADRGSKDAATVRYELHAPQEAVTASGTVQRGYGVYFKLRPSPLAAVEGARRFTVTFRVSRRWRGDYLQVHCQADGIQRGMVRSLDQPQPCGRRDFFVALYQASDLEAKARAEAMVDSEATLQKMLSEFRDELDAQEESSLVSHFVGLLQKPVDRPSAKRQLEQLIFHQVPHTPANLPRGLPKPLRRALVEYLEARDTLRLYAG